MTVRTGMGIWGSRYLSPKLATEAAAGIEAVGAGAVDQFVLWDQLTSWWPRRCGSPRPPRWPG